MGEGSRRKQLKIAKETAHGQEETRRTTKEFNDKHKEVKRSFRADKRKWAEDLATKAQEAEREGDIRELYKITKTLSNRKTKQQKPVKNREGNLIIEEAEQLERWREHFEEILNQHSDTQTIDVEDSSLETVNQNISVDPPTKQEIVKAVRELKNGKAPGNDNLPPEVFKQDPITSANILHPIFCEIWETERPHRMQELERNHTFADT